MVRCAVGLRVAAVVALSVTLAVCLSGASALASGWSIQRVPTPAGASIQLRAVSCVSSACIAVGSYVTPAGVGAALAERWNGKRWTIQSTPAINGTIISSGQWVSGLDGVSCVSQTACSAVGFDVNPATGSYSTLVERWNGHRWTLQPSAMQSGLLFGVSCVTAKACTAVGSALNAGLRMLVERWNGKRWATQTFPYGGLDTFPLGGVSCASTTACLAITADAWSGDCLCVGGFAAFSWNGRQWSDLPEQRVPAGSPFGNSAGVACPSRSECMVVGGGRVGGWAGRWSESKWTIQPLPNAFRVRLVPGLDGVSCPSPTVCTAVGGYSFGVLGQPALGSSGDSVVAYRWNGKRWLSQRTPIPTRVTSSGLAAVSCPTTTACTAVGSYYNPAGQQLPLVERWSHTR